MKKILIPFIFLCAFCQAQIGYNPIPTKQWNKDTVLNTKAMKINSQGGLIVGGYNLNSDAVLEVSSTTKTFLPPRMTGAQRTAISSPTNGAIVFDVDSGKICFYNSGWTCLSNSGGGGGATGATGPTGATGATGAQGITGADGADITGTPNSVFFAAPDGSITTNQNFVYDSVNGTFLFRGQVNNTAINAVDTDQIIVLHANTILALDSNFNPTMELTKNNQWLGDFGYNYTGTHLKIGADKGEIELRADTLFDVQSTDLSYTPFAIEPYKRFIELTADSIDINAPINNYAGSYSQILKGADTTFTYGLIKLPTITQESWSALYGNIQKSVQTIGNPVSQITQISDSASFNGASSTPNFGIGMQNWTYEDKTVYKRYVIDTVNGSIEAGISSFSKNGFQSLFYKAPSNYAGGIELHSLSPVGLRFFNGDTVNYYNNAFTIALDTPVIAGMVMTATKPFGNWLGEWKPSSTTGLDSVSIYALTPTAGTEYYCNNCTGNGITGRIVAFIGGLWRRLTFE